MKKEKRPKNQKEIIAGSFGRKTVRIAIALYGDSLRKAGFGKTRISDDSDARAYRNGLEREQDEVISRIEACLGHPLYVRRRFTRNVNVISADVFVEEIDMIRSVRGVKSVSIEQLNHLHSMRPDLSME